MQTVAQSEVIDQRPSVEPLNVLVVDDEAGICSLLAYGLSMHGFRVYLANTGEAALILFRQRYQSLDLVLLDLNLPGLNGRETLLAMKNIDPEIPVVLTSCIGNTELAAGLGAAGFLPKPYPRIAEVAEILRAKCRVAGAP
jgi:DNA-binding response OmpR family regulator